MDDMQLQMEIQNTEKKLDSMESKIEELEYSLPTHMSAVHMALLGKSLNNEIEYLNLLSNISSNGERKEDRTGTGTIGTFGQRVVYNLEDGFPLFTTKKIHFKSIVHELLWMMSGSTNTKYLVDNGVTIWNEWADAGGNLGPVYGKQWRDFNGVDQLLESIKQIKENPYSRRIITSFWNPAEINNMALPPCHMMHQFYVSTDGTLSLQLYQRSCDMFLGVPFNVAFYSLFLMMVAQVTDLIPGKLIHVMGDAHIYINHFDQVDEQLTRPPKLPPKVRLNPEIKNILDFKFEDITLEDYNPHPAIKAPVAV